MRNHNPNEAITNLAIAERALPVLLECNESQRDGSTGLPDISPDSKNVRRIPLSALEVFFSPRTRTAFEQRFGPVAKRHEETLLYLIGLADAINRRDTRSLKRAIQKYVKDDEQRGAVFREVSSSPLYELQRTINLAVRGTRFVLWWAEREQKLAPGLLCKDIDAAVFILAVSIVGQPGGLGVCQRPQCRKPFIRARPGPKQKYCCDNCQAAAGMMRYRRRNALGK